jgi:hypothetical protein
MIFLRKFTAFLLPSMTEVENRVEHANKKQKTKDSSEDKILLLNYDSEEETLEDIFANNKPETLEDIFTDNKPVRNSLITTQKSKPSCNFLV